MNRTANFIEFTHPTRAKRSIRFERTGKKAIHATGGVWGERDWFETLHPDGEAMLVAIAERMASYRREGFSVARARVHDRRAAEVLGLAIAARPGAIAEKAKQDRSKAQHSAQELLSAPLPSGRKAIQVELRRTRALYARSLGAALRRQVRARLDQLHQRLEVTLKR